MGLNFKKEKVKPQQGTEVEPTYFHTLTPAELVQSFSTDLDEGLTTAQVKESQAKYGLNELSGSTGVSPIKILIRQVANMLTLILLIATVIAFATQDWIEGGVIAAIIITNSLIGFFQEFKAEKTMESLRRLASPTTNVIRDGHRTKVPTNQLVPGDIIILENGDVVGADARVTDQFNLSIDEALLTGESVPVEKSTPVITDRDVPVGDRINLCFSSTTVTKGRGKAIVVATGMKTEIGKIATTLNDSEGNHKTSLQRTMDRMALVVFAVAILLAIIVFSVNKWQVDKNVAIYAVAVSIAIIPEGLIAVITLTMAAGVRNMAKNKAIVRQLTALETLGSITNICSDKTGTLTQAKMVLTRFWLPGDGYYTVTGVGYTPIGEILREGELPDDDLNRLYTEKKKSADKVDIAEMKDHLLRLTQVASLCNIAKLKKDKVSGDWIGLGDPTENAMQTFAYKLNMGQPTLTDMNGSYQFELLAEFPFDSTIKLMSVVFKHIPSQRTFIFTKGAMERVLNKCVSLIDNNQVRTLKSGNSNELIDLCTPHMEHLASQGLRTLCTAYREVADDDFKGLEPSSWSRDSVESNLTMIGLVGIYDPPRLESRPSVMACYQAGIQVHMLTGDHPATATAIARDVGIIPDNTPAPGHTVLDLSGNNLVMTAQQFDALTEEQIDSMHELPHVIARCSPDTKVKMIRALHRRKLVAAMTGDGVNDSPSLKIANVGIGMGLSGSDVAKQASDIVLTDDNFATIVRAIEEGRRIFENIVKFVLHLMSANTAEIVALVIGLCFTDLEGKSVFPMSPIQILFLNMITSSPPAMGLGLEPVQRNSMLVPPRPITGGLFTFEVILDILYFGLVMGALTFANFVMVIFYFGDGNLHKGCNDDFQEGECSEVFRARATAYTCLTLLILLHAFNCRSLRKPAWSLNGIKSITSNKFLAWSVVAGILLLFPALYIPGLNHSVFRHEAITWEWGIVLVSCVIFIILSEAFKACKRRFMKSNKIVVDDN